MAVFSEEGNQEISRLKNIGLEILITVFGSIMVKRRRESGWKRKIRERGWNFIFQ